MELTWIEQIINQKNIAFVLLLVAVYVLWRENQSYKKDQKEIMEAIKEYLDAQHNPTVKNPVAAKEQETAGGKTAPA